MCTWEPFLGGWSGRILKLTIDLRLMLKWRMCGALLPLPLMSSRLDDQLSPTITVHPNLRNLISVGSHVCGTKLLRLVSQRTLQVGCAISGSHVVMTHRIFPSKKLNLQQQNTDYLTLEDRTDMLFRNVGCPGCQHKPRNMAEQRRPRLYSSGCLKSPK